MTTGQRQLIGRKFGRLTVLRIISIKEQHWKYLAECICECGIIKTYSRNSIIAGSTKSCGCLNRELTRTRSVTHGLRHTKEYAIWCDMKTRCYNANRPEYKRYGGRGIMVCDRWHDFSNFVKDMGPRPVGLSLERIDNNGNYCPSNCKWATPQEQSNNRRSNRYIYFSGQTKTLSEWSRITGIPVAALGARISRLGWTISEALTTPVRKDKRSNPTPVFRLVKECPN